MQAVWPLHVLRGSGAQQSGPSGGWDQPPPTAPPVPMRARPHSPDSPYLARAECFWELSWDCRSPVCQEGRLGELRLS